MARSNCSRVVETPNHYLGTDIERINQAVAAAAVANKRVVIPRVNECGDHVSHIWVIDSAILLPGGVTLELDNCHIRLSDRCRDNFIRSSNCGHGIAEIIPIEGIYIIGRGRALLEGANNPRSTGDSAKRLGVRTYGTDADKPDESQTGDWRNIGILLASVSHFSIENITIKDSHCWAISLERCSSGRVRDIEFSSHGSKAIGGHDRTILNQDGLDLRQGCHDILIENITGATGDDLVAFTAIPHANEVSGEYNSTMVSSRNPRAGETDDIFAITVRNIRGYCRGHHIVRFLNTGGMKLHDVILDGLIDTSPPDIRCRAALKIGDSQPAWGGVTPLGDTYRIIVNNVISRAKDTVLIAGALSESCVTNVIKHDGDGEAIVITSGTEHLRSVAVSNVHTMRT